MDFLNRQALRERVERTLREAPEPMDLVSVFHAIPDVLGEQVRRAVLELLDERQLVFTMDRRLRPPWPRSLPGDP